MFNGREARMAEWSRGLGHIVTPTVRLARIAHDPQHVCQRQLASCGCFQPQLLVCTAGRSLGAAGARPFSTVSVHRAIDVVENRRMSDARSHCTTIRYIKATYGRGYTKNLVIIFLPTQKPTRVGG